MGSVAPLTPTTRVVTAYALSDWGCLRLSGVALNELLYVQVFEWPRADGLIEVIGNASGNVYPRGVVWLVYVQGISSGIRSQILHRPDGNCLDSMATRNCMCWIGWRFQQTIE